MSYTLGDLVLLEVKRKDLERVLDSAATAYILDEPENEAFDMLQAEKLRGEIYALEQMIDAGGQVQNDFPDVKPLSLEVQIGFDDHVSVYEINLETVYKIERAENAQHAFDWIMAEGTYVDHQTEGEVFFDLSGYDSSLKESALAEFQQAIFEWLNENEEAVAVNSMSAEDYK